MIGKVLGHYRVFEKIGFGGMGEVYRASDERLGRAAAVLNHPNIVAIYDIGIHDGGPYIVSELLVGQTLRERLLDGPLSRNQAIDYARQIVQGLMAAHEKRIVHRDLKPENLFITKDDRVKILDFGIAKLLTSEFGSEPGKAGPIEALTTQTKI